MRFINQLKDIFKYNIMSIKVIVVIMILCCFIHENNSKSFFFLVVLYLYSANTKINAIMFFNYLGLSILYLIL